MKKLLLSLLTAIILFSSFAIYFPRQSKAADFGPVWYDTHIFSFPQWYLKIYDDESTPPTEVFGERYTAAQVQWIGYSLMSNVLNTLVTRQFGVCLMKIPAGDVSVVWTCVDAIIDLISPISFNNQDKDFSITNFFASQPVSGIGYVINTLNNINLVPQVNAQGFGYNTGGNMIKQIWVSARNVAYTLLVVVVLILSFMVMFRIKLSAQTSVTIQSALPKVIMATILVTFSYAIAGFFIDLMYLLIGILSVIIANTSPIITSLDAIALFRMFTQGSNILVSPFIYVGIFLGSSVSTLLQGSLAGLAGVLLTFILFFHTVFSVFKMVIMVFKAFANIIIGIITAPLEILVGTVTSGGFGSWAKKMFSNLAIFPVLCVMFFFVYFFLAQAAGSPPSGSEHVSYGVQDITSGDPWTPPFLPKTKELLWILVSYVIFVSIPKAGEVASGIISGKMPQLESEVGQATAAGFARARGVATAPVGWGASALGYGAQRAAAYSKDTGGTEVQQLGAGLPWKIGASILQRIRGGH